MKNHLTIYTISIILLLSRNGAANNYCGTDWADADATCAIACPNGDSECPVEQKCFSGTCTGGGGEGNKYNYCGTDWNDANSNCKSPCVGGRDYECPQGTRCFSDCTSCDPISPPTPKEPTPALTLIVPTTKAPLVEHPCDRKAKMSVNVGYYQSWAVWRNGCSVVTPEDIDVEGMGYTHLVYSFASISSSLTLQAWEGNDSEHFPRMAQFNALKQKYPGLKTLLAVGRWTHNDPGELCDRFSRSSATAESRQKFADSVVTFLNAVSKTLCSHAILFK